MGSQKKKRKKCKVCMRRKHEVEDCPCAVDECSEGDACSKCCMVDCDQNFKYLADECIKHQLMGHSRKEVRKLQEACERLRDAYAAEFEDELSDDGDGWVGLETDIHHVGIPKVEEKEVQKEVGQKSLKLPLDSPTLPLECAHRVEMEYPLLKLMSVLSLVNEIYYLEEKQIIHIEDVVHKNQRPFEEADNVRNGQVDSRMNGLVMDRERNEEEEVIDLLLGSIENVCRITNEDSKQEEFQKLDDSNSDFNSDSVSILDLDSTAILDAKTNSDANFNGSRGKLDEENKYERVDRALLYKGHEQEYPKCQILVQIHIPNGAEFYHGYCQAICQFGIQDDDVNVEVEDVQQNADLMSKFRYSQERGAAKKARNVAGGVEVAVGIQDLRKDLKSGSRIAELQMEFGLRIRNVWQKKALETDAEGVTGECSECLYP
ncbi:hypothetical protein L7F22_025656 [Adiantum nelumboides]|nr:hypothetical protein [Adiantum nelumboides]